MDYVEIKKRLLLITDYVVFYKAVPDKFSVF